VSDSPPTILYVDDDEHLCRLFTLLLKQEGFQVRTAATGREALRLVAEQPSLVLLDVQLPDLSGFEVCRRIKTDPATASIPVLHLSAVHTDSEDRAAGLEGGADGYLIKPAAPREVLAHVRAMLRVRQAEEALRQERDFAHNVIHAAQVIVLVLDAAARVVRANRFLADVSGRTPAEVQGQDAFATFFAPHDQPHLRELFRKALAGAPQGSHLCPVQTWEGPARAIDWRAQSLKDDRDAVSGVLFIGHDVTDLRQAQERALQAERLAAVGAMVTVLAHESRNALQGSQACLEMLRWELHGRRAALDLLGRLQQEQDRLHHLHEDLRDYVAPLRLRRDVCDLAGVWRKAWASLASVPGHRQALLREDTGGLDLRCSADAFRLEQVFRNLLDNSLAACPAPAHIDIRCSEATLAGGPVLRVAVRDNGPGLGAEQRQKLFDAFYTTKMNGTGLGLAISKRIVEAHGGQIAVGGTGPGTEILVTLPRRKP
jgi:PAS domain S-box-containing protein